MNSNQIAVRVILLSFTYSLPTVVEGILADQYIGCYKDALPRDLGHIRSIADQNLTVEWCIEACREKEYTYAGMQHADDCYCGDSFGKYNRSDLCARACAGDSSQVCGGYRANSIYLVCPPGKYGAHCEQECGRCPDACDFKNGTCLAESQKTETKPINNTEMNIDGQFLGCYSDSPKRDLVYVQAVDAKQLTVNDCITACKDNNYTYAGVQNSKECYCGDSYGKYGQSCNCESKCSGNSEQICGGDWSNSVYSVCPPRKYGEECDKDCNYDGICHAESGTCPVLAVG